MDAAVGARRDSLLHISLQESKLLHMAFVAILVIAVNVPYSCKKEGPRMSVCDSFVGQL
jgi:hypothetical protein